MNHPNPTTAAPLLAALLLILSACSQEEQAPATPVEQTAPVTEQQTEQPAQEVTEAVSETIEVVEESSADPEPVDEAIVLAAADVPAVTREWQFKEGQHYVRMVPSQPT